MGAVHQSPSIRSTVPGALTLHVPSLRYWRGQRALLQSQLSERSGVAAISIYRGENGQPLRVDTIAKLARALEVKPADLMGQPPAS